MSTAESVAGLGWRMDSARVRAQGARNVAPTPWTPRWWYFTTVTVVGVLALVLVLALERDALPALGGSLTFWILIGLTMVGETRPILLMRAAEGSRVVISAVFVFAALLHLGVASAVLLHAVGTTAVQVLRRHAPYRSLFNVAVYTLAVISAAGVLELGGTHLPAIVLAMAAYFGTQFLLVSLAVAVTDRVRLISVMRRDFSFEAASHSTLLALSPLVVVVIEHAPVLMPLFILPLGAMLKQASALQERDFHAYHDMLTGLPNRELLVIRATKALAEASRTGTCVALFLLDLDRFKEINDTLGHATGDRILQQVARRLASTMRPRDTVARLGGDEFAVLLPVLHEPESALHIATRMREVLAEPLLMDGMLFDIEGSIGIAIHPQHAGDFESLLQRADVAMYVAKESRRGIEVYDAEIDQNSPVRLALLGQLRRAIETDQLELHYQPKALLADRSVVGVEALVRWRHPERGLVPPDEFIPLAEQSGLVCLLTDWVLDRAVRQSAEWRVLGLAIQVSVNVSVRDLLAPDFAQTVAAALARHDLPGTCLRLEITERVLMAEPDRAARTLEELAAHGVSVSLDDFGTGYSSLVRLRRLPVSEIKVDRSFVYQISTDENAQAIVRSIVDLGRSLGIVTVAEGVETEEDWQVLRDMGCHSAQGWLLGRPMPARAATAWLSAQLISRRQSISTGS